MKLPDEIHSVRLSLWQEGHTDKEIAEQTCYALETIRGWRHKNGLSANSPKHCEKMTLYKQGLSDNKIATELGYASPCAIYRWRKSKGLPANGVAWGKGRGQE